MTAPIQPAGMALLVVVLATALAGLGYLIFNGGMTRFQQTSIACQDPLFGPFEMVINARRAGDSVRLIRPHGDSRPVITSVDADGLAVRVGESDLRIIFDGPFVVVTQGTRQSRSRCKMTDFAM
jgi:hypothetical protein